jgi:transketolase
MRDRFARVATELLDSDPRVAVVLADISADRFHATGAMARYPGRVINVGIREQLMVSVAGGLALEGMRPIAHSYAPFLVERAFEQVKLDFAHQGVGGILVSVGASYDWTAGGRTHHAPEDVALLSALPDWRVVVPGHPDEAEEALRAAAFSEEPVYIRLSDRANPEPHADEGISVLRLGSRDTPTVLAVGPALRAAAEGLAEIDLTLLYTSTVCPLDADGLRGTVEGPDIILVEAYLEGTTAPLITAALNDRPLRLLSIGVPRVEHRHYGSPADYDRAFGLDAAGIRRRVEGWLKPERGRGRVTP